MDGWMHVSNERTWVAIFSRACCMVACGRGAAVPVVAMAAASSRRTAKLSQSSSSLKGSIHPSAKSTGTAPASITFALMREQEQPSPYQA